MGPVRTRTMWYNTGRVLDGAAACQGGAPTRGKKGAGRGKYRLVRPGAPEEARRGDSRRLLLRPILEPPLHGGHHRRGGPGLDVLEKVPVQIRGSPRHQAATSTLRPEPPGLPVAISLGILIFPSRQLDSMFPGIICSLYSPSDRTSLCVCV